MRTHLCPADGSGVTGCCRRPPFELGEDQMTLNPVLVTCEQVWLPTVGEGERLDEVPLERWVGEALGAASSCWANLAGAGEFDSTRCARIADALLAYVGALLAEVEEREADAYPIGPGFMWLIYEACPVCGAGPKQPCVDALFSAHDGRLPFWEARRRRAEQAEAARACGPELHDRVAVSEEDWVGGAEGAAH